MAVARMLRVTVLGHSSVLESVVDRMQRAGALDIEAIAEGEAPGVGASDPAVIRRLEEYRADASFVSDFLGRHHTNEQPFGAFISEKLHMSEGDFAALEVDTALLHVYRQCQGVADRVAVLGRERSHLSTLAQDLAPWEGLRLEIGRWQGSEHVALFAGVLPASDGPGVRQMLRDLSPYVSVEELSSVGGRCAWIVMAHRTVVDEVRTALAGTGFIDVGFPGLIDYPAEERAVALERIEAIDQELAELDERSAALSEQYYTDAVALVAAIDANLDAAIVREQFGATERTFMVTGWVSVRRQQVLDEALAPISEALDITYEDPRPGDDPPVELENPKILRPFEVLTDLYGRPRYGEIDPTPLLAPFFWVFFSICIGDVGYGLMLIVAAWLIKAKLDVAPGVKKLMDLFMVGGVGAIFAGVAMGSYFAWDLELPPLLESLRLINPMEELTTFLIFSIGLGILQVLFGVFVSAWGLARKGDWGAAVFDQASTFVLFGAIAVAVLVPSMSQVAIVLGLGLTALGKSRAVDVALRQVDAPLWDKAVGAVWLMALVGWLLSLAFGWTAPLGWVLLAVSVFGIALSKATRRVAAAILGGLYAVYGLSSLIGDILSYTRLAALALSATLVGMVFNLLARLVGSGAAGMFEKGGGALIGGVVIMIFAALIFVVGHVFNVVINLLSAFVHPARLQFVEFFGKFYEGGGRTYTPFAFKSKTVVLHADTVRQEGAGT
ncbi:MAG: V-type ATP synthase subunit I [Coriobacteriia bacterium]